MKIGYDGVSEMTSMLDSFALPCFLCRYKKKWHMLAPYHNEKYDKCDDEYDKERCDFCSMDRKFCYKAMEKGKIPDCTQIFRVSPELEKWLVKGGIAAPAPEGCALTTIQDYVFRRLFRGEAREIFKEGDRQANLYFFPESLDKEMRKKYKWEEPSLENLIGDPNKPVHINGGVCIKEDNWLEAEEEQ